MSSPAVGFAAAASVVSRCAVAAGRFATAVVAAAGLLQLLPPAAGLETVVAWLTAGPGIAAAAKPPAAAGIAAAAAVAAELSAEAEVELKKKAVCT